MNDRACVDAYKKVAVVTGRRPGKPDEVGPVAAFLAGLGGSRLDYGRSHPGRRRISLGGSEMTTNGHKINGRRFQFLGYRRTRTNAQGSFAREFRRVFPRRRSLHDPMLVLNMSVFNFTDGWNRTFNKVQENVT